MFGDTGDSGAMEACDATLDARVMRVRFLYGRRAKPTDRAQARNVEASRERFRAVRQHPRVVWSGDNASYLRPGVVLGSFPV